MKTANFLKQIHFRPPIFIDVEATIATKCWKCFVSFMLSELISIGAILVYVYIEI